MRRRPVGRQGEVAADRVEADDHARPGVVAQVGGDQPAVVAADGQLDVRGALGAGRRVAAGAATAVDLDGEVDVLAGPESGERLVRFQASVTLRGVWRRTATTFARASPAVQVGSTSSVYRSTPWGPVSSSRRGDRRARRVKV